MTPFMAHGDGTLHAKFGIYGLGQGLYNHSRGVVGFLVTRKVLTHLRGQGLVFRSSDVISRDQKMSWLV